MVRIRCRFCNWWFYPKRPSFFRRIFMTPYEAREIRCPRCKMIVGKK